MGVVRRGHVSLEGNAGAPGVNATTPIGKDISTSLLSLSKSLPFISCGRYNFRGSPVGTVLQFG